MKKKISVQVIIWALLLLSNTIYAIVWGIFDMFGFQYESWYFLVYGIIAFVTLTWRLRKVSDSLINALTILLKWFVECVVGGFLLGAECSIVRVAFGEIDGSFVWIFLCAGTVYLMTIGIICLVSVIISKIFYSMNNSKYIMLFVWTITFSGTVIGFFIIERIKNDFTFGPLGKEIQALAIFFIAFQIIFMISAGVAFLTFRFFQKNYIAYIVWFLLIACTFSGTAHFMITHQTYYKYNDCKIVGKTVDQVQVKYGPFDSIAEGQAEYYLFYGEGLEHYYVMYIENGIVTKVEIRGKA